MLYDSNLYPGLAGNVTTGDFTRLQLLLPICSPWPQLKRIIFGGIAHFPVEFESSGAHLLLAFAFDVLCSIFVLKTWQRKNTATSKFSEVVRDSSTFFPKRWPQHTCWMDCWSTESVNALTLSYLKFASEICNTAYALFGSRTRVRTAEWPVKSSIKHQLKQAPFLL